MDFGPYDVAGTFEVSMTGDGDADLYVRKGAVPTDTAYDCRPFQDDSTESCSMQVPGRYWISIYGYAPVSNFTLDTSW